MPTERHDPFAPGLLSRLPLPRRVAVVKPSRIGDFLCAVPALRALRHALPQAEITLITLPLLRELAARSALIDHYAPFPGYPGIAEQLFDPRATVDFFRAQQAEQYDLALQLQGSGVNANPFTLMLGAHATAGFVRPHDPPGRLTAALPLPSSGHEIERMLALTSFLGAVPQGMHSEFPLWPQDIAAAAALLAGAAPPLIGMHVGAHDQTRRWPPACFAVVGKILQQHYGGTVLLLGAAADRPLTAQVAAELGPAARDLTGCTALATLGAVIDRLALLVSNDTGPAHIAYARRTPTVTIFGGADPQRYGPPSGGPFRAIIQPIECRPCPGPACPIGYACLTAVGPEQVVSAARDVLYRAHTVGV